MTIIKNKINSSSLKDEQIKLVSATDVAKMKRIIDGATKTIESCDKKIKALAFKLEKPGISLSEKRIIRSKTIALNTKRYEAQQRKKETELICREVVLDNNKIHIAQLISQRYEDRSMLNYDAYVNNWKTVLETKANEDDNIRGIQLRLLELSNDDTRTEFNQVALSLLGLIDDKVVKKLKYAKSLRPKLLNSLHEFFENHPSYLPEPRVIRFEESLQENTDDEMIEEVMQ